MALIVEDGTGLSTAESYASVATLTAYATARGLSLTGTEAVKETQLREATAYLDGKYRHRYIGSRANSDQALAWPRELAVDADGYLLASDELPDAVVNACCRAAYLINAGNDLRPSLARGGQIVSVKVEGAVEVHYAPGASTETAWTAISSELSAVLKPRGVLSLA